MMGLTLFIALVLLAILTSAYRESRALREYNHLRYKHLGRRRCNNP